MAGGYPSHPITRHLPLSLLSYVSASSDGDSESDSDSGESGEGRASSQESLSYDEGSYDGRLGQITYKCKDDEAIEAGQPGAVMFDQNIRET